MIWPAFLLSSEHPKRFNDKSCETIANCWPALTKLSIGGTGITTTGLLHIAKGCLRLQELELDRTHHVTEETAYALCLTGLRGLQILLFTFTTASPGAIKQFYGKYQYCHAGFVSQLFLFHFVSLRVFPRSFRFSVHSYGTHKTHENFFVPTTKASHIIFINKFLLPGHNPGDFLTFTAVLAKK